MLPGLLNSRTVMLLPAVPYIFHRKKKRKFAIFQRLSEYEGECGQRKRHHWPFFVGKFAGGKTSAVWSSGSNYVEYDVIRRITVDL